MFVLLEDVELVDHARTDNPARVLDMAHNQAKGTWLLLVRDLATDELDVWDANGVRVLPRDAERERTLKARRRA